MTPGSGWSIEEALTGSYLGTYPYKRCSDVLDAAARAFGYARYLDAPSASAASYAALRRAEREAADDRRAERDMVSRPRG